VVGDAPPFGFSGPGGGAAWLPQPDGWPSLTATRHAADPASMLTLYRAALRLRRTLPALADGTLAWVPAAGGVLAFRRDPGFACVVNVGDDPAHVPGGLREAPILLGSRRLDTAGRLPGYTAVWYRL
jgi:alpha-glucosidase